MIGIDFNSFTTFSQYTFNESLKGLANASWTDCFLTTDRLSSKEAIRQMRSPISRQLSSKDFFLFRSVPVYGVRSDNIPTEPSRHRNLFTSNATKTLPLRHSQKRFTQYLGKCKRASKLENIRRLRTSVNKQGSKTLCQLRLRNSVKARGLCSGFNNHRFMSVTISMGQVSQTQSGTQGTHTNGPEGLYPLFYPHYRRKSTRCKYPRRTDFRAKRNLHKWIVATSTLLASTALLKTFRLLSQEPKPI